jgi:hypothetical protein
VQTFREDPEDSEAVIANPDCRDGKHGSCNGVGFDLDKDREAACPCNCHTEGGK